MLGSTLPRQAVQIALCIKDQIRNGIVHIAVHRVEGVQQSFCPYAATWTQFEDGTCGVRPSTLRDPVQVPIGIQDETAGRSDPIGPAAKAVNDFLCLGLTWQSYKHTEGRNNGYKPKENHT